MRFVNLAMQDGAPAELVLATRDEAGREAVYTRAFLPPQRLILLGGGHVSQPLCRYAADLAFDVTVVDDRPSFANAARFPEAGKVVCDAFPKALQELFVTRYDFVCVITRGHRYDAVCLRQLLAGEMPRYLGLIGSRRRTIELFNLLEEEGFDRRKIDMVHTPIGLPIGAETPKEIAVSILAELIQQRSSRSAAREAERLALTSHEPELLGYLLSKKEPCALAVVVEKSGSTPVPTGAIMAVNQYGSIVGTVGGGCGEHEILNHALETLRTGRARLVTLDMSNDVAEEEGMVCGGRMKVWIERFSEE
ncbi:MAG: xanthine dehydrogenase [Clostridiales bacterium]|nr:xanthine dehydrogenase [Clostridiales bacterium]